jgi:hypothetical protein
VRTAKRRQQAELAWAAACQDARYLAIELAAGRPAQPIDVMRLGLMIEPDETAYRYVCATISQYEQSVGLWPIPTPVAILITDRRLIARLPHGAVILYWWHSVVALDVNLAAGRVVLDFGDNEPRALGGPAVFRHRSSRGRPRLRRNRHASAPGPQLLETGRAERSSCAIADLYQTSDDHTLAVSLAKLPSIRADESMAAAVPVQGNVSLRAIA